MNQKILLSVLFSVTLLSVVPLQTAEAHHCDITHIGTCFEDVKNAIDGVVNDVKRVETDVIRVEDKVVSMGETLDKDVVNVVKVIESDVKTVKTDVIRVEQKVTSIEKSLGNDIVTVVKDIENSVSEIEKDAASLEKTVVNDVKNDVKEIKDDVAKIEKLVVSVERIEKKVVDTTEEIIKAIIGDIKSDFVYIIYGTFVIVIGYVVIRIVQFAIWLKAYLRQDGIEHSAKRQVEQNNEIIALLKKMTK